MGETVACESRFGKILGHVVSDHVVGSTVLDGNDIVGDAFAKGVNTVVDVARARLDGVFAEETTGAVVLEERGGESLGSAGISENAANPENIVCCFAGGDVLSFCCGCGDAFLLFGGPMNCSSCKDEDCTTVGPASVGAGCPVGVSPGLEVRGVGAGRCVCEAEISSTTEVA